MKFLLIIPQRFDTKNVSGIGAYSVGLAKELIQLGHQVSILTQADTPTEWIHQNISFYSIPHPQVTYSRNNIIQKIGSICCSDLVGRVIWAKRVRYFVNKRLFDVVESPEWQSSTLGLLLGTRAKIVVRLHKSELQYKRENALPPHISDYIADFLERLCILCASMVTSPTRFMATQYPLISHVRDLIHSSIVVLPNGIGVTQTNSAIPLHIKKPYVLTVGRIEVGKGSYILAQAFARIAHTYPTLHVYYVGDDTIMYINGLWQSYKMYIRTFLKQRGIDKRIHFISHQTGKELAGYYANCLFYITPSVGYENASMSLLEAISYKKAVIGSDAGGTKEIIRQTKRGKLFRAKDVKDLAFCMKYMIGHPRRRKAYESSAIPEEYSFKHVALMYELLCHKLLHITV